jgi:UDP-N-acetylglucosamine 4,6-dehydratase
MQRFSAIGVIRNAPDFDAERLDHFLNRIADLRASLSWRRADLVSLFHGMLDNFEHKETGRYLDSRM